MLLQESDTKLGSGQGQRGTTGKLERQPNKFAPQCSRNAATPRPPGEGKVEGPGRVTGGGASSLSRECPGCEHPQLVNKDLILGDASSLRDASTTSEELSRKAPPEDGDEHGSSLRGGKHAAPPARDAVLPLSERTPLDEGASDDRQPKRADPRVQVEGRTGQGTRETRPTAAQAPVERRRASEVPCGAETYL